MNQASDPLEPSAEDPVDVLSAKAYASRIGVSLAEGFAAMELQYGGSEVCDEIEMALGNDWGGCWFENDPAGRRLKIAVRSCGDPPADPSVSAAERILAHRGLLDHVDFVHDALTSSE